MRGGASSVAWHMISCGGRSLLDAAEMYYSSIWRSQSAAGRRRVDDGRMRQGYGHVLAVVERVGGAVDGLLPLGPGANVVVGGRGGRQRGRRVEANQLLRGVAQRKLHLCRRDAGQRRQRGRLGSQLSRRRLRDAGQHRVELGAD